MQWSILLEPEPSLSTLELNIQITHLQFSKQPTQQCAKRVTYSDRFRYDIQKLKIDGDNMYKLILPVEGERNEAKVIECKFLFSYADMGMCQEYQFSVEDMTKFPIIDVFELQNTVNPQIYHKIVTSNQTKKLMKYYSFTSFSDYEFKRALYELSLYKTMPHSKLQNYFILFKGDTKQLVMIFQYSYMSLQDVLFYRKTAVYEWEERELLIVARMICEQLVELAQVGIVHRDVRPSNVFFTTIGIINDGQINMYGVRDKSIRGQYLVRETISSDRFYTLFNLESARMVDRPDLPQDQNGDDLLTVKGSPAFTEGPVKDALLRNQHKANYNPFHNDILGLKNTIMSMVNLEPMNVGTTYEERLDSKPKIQKLLKYLSLSSISIEQVMIYIDELLGINSVKKPDSYYSLIQEFYLKELTICQNIQTNLYFSPPSPASSFLPQSNLSLSSKLPSLPNSYPQSISQPYSQPLPQPLSFSPPILPSRSIDLRNLPPAPRNPTLQYIESLYIKTLYDLHKKDKFVSYMLQKLSRNYEMNKKQENVGLLMKVGGYFQESGVRENQYYKEAILLLVELAQQQRIEGFYKDHQRLATQAQQLFSKFTSQSKGIFRARCMFLKQKAYKQMLSTSTFQPSQALYRQLFTNTSNQFQTSQQIITQAYLQAQKANLPIEEQLELIYSRGELAMYMNKIEEGETYFINGYQIAERNYKEFLTAHNCNKYKGRFQYALAMVDIVRLRQGFIQRAPKVLFDIEQKLQKAKERFSSVKIHPVFVIKCYMALGDLYYIREDAPNSSKNYQRALNLLHAQNQTRTQQNQLTRAISARIQVQIVSKLIQVLNRANNQVQAHRYESLFNSLKKEFNLARKNQSGYSRKGKSSKLRKDKQQIRQQQQQQQSNLAPILEVVQEENKMFESRTRPLDLGYHESMESQMRMESQINVRVTEHVSEF